MRQHTDVICLEKKMYFALISRLVFFEEFKMKRFGTGSVYEQHVLCQ